MTEQERKRLVEIILSKTKSGEIRWRKEAEPPPLPEQGEWRYSVASLELPEIGLVVLTFVVPSKLETSHRGRCRLEIVAADGQPEVLYIEPELGMSLWKAIEEQAQPGETIAEKLLRALEQG